MKITRKKLRQLIKEASDEESRLLKRFRSQQLSPEEKKQLELRRLAGHGLTEEEIDYFTVGGEIDSARYLLVNGSSKAEIISTLRQFFPDAHGREQAIYQYVMFDYL